MKKALILSLLVLVAAVGFAEEAEKPSFDLSLGFDFPTIGFSIEKNDDGQMVAVRGVNIGLGYSAKHFFKPAELNSFNGFWHWGTVALIVPYIGVGAEYITNSGFYFSIFTVYIAPAIGFGVYL